ncbi:DUF6183 family protein [Streptomyces sp. NPDC051567]|uniref:DUF6183 family protein n=1 Tax=Streptomyces sp. NPDC051567 TaxID=3365660 RepID=UPI003795F70B
MASGQPDHFEQIHQWAEAGDVVSIGMLAHEFTLRERGEECSTEISFARERLATIPGLDAIAQVLSLLESAEPAEVRFLAAALARHQNAGDLVAGLFGRATVPSHTHELKACLLHELVLEGVRVEGFSEILEFGDLLARQDHPLGDLPLRRLPVEVLFKKPVYLSDAPSGERIYQQPSFSGCTLVKLHDPSAEESIKKLLGETAAETFGKISADIFKASRFVGRENISGAIKGLSLPYVRRSQGDPFLISPEVALRLLFALAASQQYGAYGRLSVWESIRGFVGAAPGRGICDLAEMVESSQWYQCIPKSSWSCDEGKALVLIAVRPDGHTIAALGATRRA